MKIVGVLNALGHVDALQPTDVGGAEIICSNQTEPVRIIGLSPEHCRALAPLLFKVVSVEINA